MGLNTSFCFPEHKNILQLILDVLLMSKFDFKECWIFTTAQLFVSYFRSFSKTGSMKTTVSLTVDWIGLGDIYALNNIEQY